MSIPKPNPCPVCKMENIEVIEIDGWNPWWRIGCPDCGYESSSQPTIKKAVELHNQEIEHTR